MKRARAQNAWRIALIVTAAVVVRIMLGCNPILGLDEKQLGAPAVEDAATLDAADANTDADPNPNRVCEADGAEFHDLDATACWSTFDLTKLGLSAPIKGFEGAAFDGHYLYLAPNGGSFVVRYDTMQPDFSVVGAWSGFDVAPLLGGSATFSGAVFDGRYVTFVPSNDAHVVVRYDTTADFAKPVAWSTFDPQVIAANAFGFAGGTFDGRYIYFIPNENTTVLRYDTQGPLGVRSSWVAFDVASVKPDINLYGGAFDGRFLYLVPESTGRVVRYDTRAAFTAPASWSVFNLATTGTTDPDIEYYVGAAFDGRFIYLGAGAASDIVSRYDTHGGFADVGSWTGFDLHHTVPGPYGGTAFDGRFVYIVPSGVLNSEPNGAVARYDTTKAFDKASAWSAFDTATIGAADFEGAAFDGKYIYSAPSEGTVVARFEARTTPKAVALPAFFGSFY